MAENFSSGTQALSKNRRFVIGVLIKATLLFFLFNLVFAAVFPLNALGRVSLYNLVFPGRARLPFGERPEKAYSLSLTNLEAMFRSHELFGTPKAADEYRVFLLGDSATWGFLLRNDETLSAALNDLNLRSPDGRQMRFYNLGYPTISLTKDLLLLDQALKFEPDMFVWLVTLEAFPRSKQLFTPLVQENPEPVRRLIETFDLALDQADPAFTATNFWEQTIVGQRRNLADLLRYQVYGTLWAATGIDQAYPETFTPVQNDLENEVEYYGLLPPDLAREDLALDVLQAGITMAGKRPVILVNEPMFISQGLNSDIRYNFYYPRWVYDEYRRILSEESRAGDWNYFDLWDRIDPSRFTNSAIHIDPQGTRQLAAEIGQYILSVLSQE
jgi:hypothetical protein